MVIEANAIVASRYRADSLLGRGGMGEVWRCRDLEEDRDVAIKTVLTLSNSALKRLFHGEVIAVARLRHYAIVQVYDLLRHDEGSSLLVMECCRGLPLANGLAPSWTFLRALLVQLLEALAHAHARSVLHLDIKPSNVLVCVDDDSRPHATLVDFGIARIKQPGRGVERWVEHDGMVGSPKYMAPEQCRGELEKLGPWSDLYALGMLAHEMCTGELPHMKDNSMGSFLLRVTQTAPPIVPRLSDVPPGFAQWCARMLSLEPRERPACAADALAALLEADRAPFSTIALPKLAAPPDLDDVPTPGAYGLFGLRELPMVGCTAERGALWHSIERTARRHPNAALIMGPAGTGKSRLVREGVERAVELGLAAVFVTNWSAEGSADEGLRGLIENALETRGHRGESFERRLAFWLDRFSGDRSALARELTVFLRPERDAAPDAALPIRVAVDIIECAATLRPVLLWLDDAQWSRGEAAALLRALAARKPIPKVCVLATVREEEIGPGFDELVNALSSLVGNAELLRIQLQSLDLQATGALVRGLLDLEPDVIDAIAWRAEGNALFATQLVRQLVMERTVVRRGRCYGLAEHVDVNSVLPGDIAAIWSRRIALAGASERELSILAIVRDRVSREVADALGRLVGSTLFDAIGCALEAGLLRQEGELYVWTHRLLREYLLRSAGPAPVFHGWAADALEVLVGLEDVQEERAHHLERATRHRDACQAMLEAALWCWRRADRQGRERRLDTLRAWSIAHRFTDLEGRALAELAHLHAEAGSVEDASRAIEAARATCSDATNVSTHAWIHLRLSQVLALRGRASDGHAAVSEALRFARQAGITEIEATCLLQLGINSYRAGEHAQAREFVAAAATIARSMHDRGFEAAVLLRQSAFESFEHREALLAAAVDVARAAGALRTELMARQVWVDALWRSGQRERARAEARTVRNEAAHRALRQTVSIVELQAACWASEEADWKRVHVHREAAGTWGAETGAMPERAFAAALDVLLAIRAGDEPAAATAIAKLEHEAKNYDEQDYRELVQRAALMAPPHLATRLNLLLPSSPR